MIGAPPARRCLLVLVLVLTALAAGSAAPQGALAAADLVVTVVDTPDPAVPGDTLTIAATVTNKGNSPAVDAVVTFTPPSDAKLETFPGCFNFVIVSCTIGATAPGTDERRFAPGATARLSITISGLVLGTADVTVGVSHNDINTDPPPNSVVSSTTVEPRADLKLELAVGTPVTIGNTTTVTATVSNSLAGPARGAQLQIVIPPDLPVAGASEGCAAAALRVTCDLGTVAPQATVTRTVQLQVPLEGSFILIGSVAWSRPDPTPVDAQSQVTLTGLAPLVPEPPGPAEPAGKPPLPRRQQVPITLLARGVPPAGKCVAARTLRLRLRRPGGVPLTQADLYVGKIRVRRLTGAALRKTVVLRGLPRKRYTLVVVSSLRDGGRLSGRRTLRACR